MPLRKTKSFSSKLNATPSVHSSKRSFDLPPPPLPLPKRSFDFPPPLLPLNQKPAPEKHHSRPLRALRSILTFNFAKSLTNAVPDANTESTTTTASVRNVTTRPKHAPEYTSVVHGSPHSSRSGELLDVVPIINIGYANDELHSDHDNVSHSSTTTSSRSNSVTTDPTSLDLDPHNPFDHLDTARDTGFRGLWKKVKPADKPDEGVPFDTDDAMFNPPAFSASGRGSYHEVTPPSAAVQHDSTNEGRHKDREHREHRERDKDRDRDREHRHKDREHKEKKSKNRIIPLEEDIRRLFQECTIGLANASLLNQALGHAKVEELKKGEVIKEFRVKCLASQELIATQIPWATAGAERSRKEREREKALLYGENTDTVRKSKERNRDRSLSQLADAAGVTGADSLVDEQTTEEKLLAALLEAHGELLGALGQFDDLERVAIERKAEKKSRKELKMDRKAIATLEQQQQLNEITASSGAGAVESVVPLRTSRSPSPASHRGSRPSSMVVQHPLPQHPSSLLTHPIQQHIASQNSLSNHSPEFPATTLAPPRAPPHGPRSPASGHGHGHTRTGSSGYPPSRTPSPNTPIIDYSSSGTGTGESVGGSALDMARTRALTNGSNVLITEKGNAAWSARKSMDESSDEEILTPIKPSAKALGKRRVDVTNEPDNSFNPDDLYYDQDRALGSTNLYNAYEGGNTIPTEGGNFNYNSESDDSDAYYPDGRPRSRNQGLLHQLRHPPVHFVYDAAAERTQQRIREMELQNQMERSMEVGNVH
ncbi:hypothetical protein C8R42DRAFT_347411 [Lentinula raphanica]|nr:hypothetical protein C8R42DRAFT_347411 [Lentinula raphanica]